MAFFPVSRFTLNSSKKISALSALLVGVGVLAGCHPAASNPKAPADSSNSPQDSKAPNFVVAEKGDWKVTRADLDKEVGDYLKQHQATPEQVGAKLPLLETAMLKNMVLKKLLLDKAADLHLKDADVDTEVNAEMDKLKASSGPDFEKQLAAAGLSVDELKKRIREKVLVGKVMDAEAFKNADPTEQEVDDIYLKNKANFTRPAKVRASRILIHLDGNASVADKAAKKKAIDKARARVMHGEEFGSVATAVSEDQSSAPKGGDLGLFQRNENEPGFDEVAFNTKVNTVSPVFETPLGYQFLKVTAIQPAGPVPIAEARGFITSKLRDMKMAQQEQDYAKKVLADSGVVYHIVLVDPPAQTAGPGGPDEGGPGPGPDNAPPAQQDASAPPAADASAAPPSSAPPAPASAASATNSAPAK
jgi:parvulin-like peptidyl-prolyl isomerase